MSFSLRLTVVDHRMRWYNEDRARLGAALSFVFWDVFGSFWWVALGTKWHELQKRTVWPCPALHSWPLAKAQLWRKSWRIFAQSIRRCYLCARQRIELWGAYDIMWLHISHISRAELCKAYRAMRSCPMLLGAPLNTSNMDHWNFRMRDAFVLDGFLSIFFCYKCCQVGASMGGFGVAWLSG